MVSIDPKALDHACLCAGRSVHHFDRMGDDLPLRSSIVAHARAIERLESIEARHAAELREQAERFSEAALLVDGDLEARGFAKTGPMRSRLAPFILPAPDPLVEAWVEATGNTVGMGPLNEALAKRGGKIVWEAGE